MSSDKVVELDKEGSVLASPGRGHRGGEDYIVPPGPLRDKILTFSGANSRLEAIKTEKAADQEESTVLISYVHSGQGVVDERFAHSMAQQSANMGQRVLGILSSSSASQVRSRNAAIQIALDMDPAPTYLLWWDTDMSVPGGALRELIDTAEEYGAKAATIFGVMQRHDHDDRHPWTPIPNAFFRLELEDPDEAVVHESYYLREIIPSHTEPFWCQSTGLGFTLVHLDLFRNFPEERLPWHYIEEGIEFGHDIRFFHYAGADVLYVPTIRSNHWKRIPLDFGMYLRAFGFDDEEHADRVAAEVIIPKGLWTAAGKWMPAKGYDGPEPERPEGPRHRDGSLKQNVLEAY